ncbi:prepilin peptidase [Salimicrobium halophilum]|uniref:Type 4 prepilin peptidase 1 Aspartic peptidase. MEROPS family A24A n=1 Tax=Salimicrobium halophilum TaxID=86666 RepID=A0A1G8PK35_9BACI|nr:A24 family peptidase [Salimicrobium halophilum]SDI92575.1 type 4 prepilin peptidase 1 Aspartic peptidase. MEROPS family A24A [Salimicrobium halophilum]
MTAIFFLFGLIFGSFFNVVGLRVPDRSLFSEERSYCPNCHKKLQWYELIPVLSWLFLRGRCSGCKAAISPMYPLMELFSGGFFAFSFWYHGWSLPLIYALLLGSLTHILIVSDIKYMVLPTPIILFFLALFAVYFLFDYPEPLWSPLVGGLLGAGMTALVILISKGGMGGGDMKLFGLLGFVMGVKALLLTFFLSAFFGAIVGGGLLVTKVISRKQPIPFGPFILISACITHFSGTMIIDWYLGSF